jgi:hypothetical protein
MKKIKTLDIVVASSDQIFFVSDEKIKENDLYIHFGVDGSGVPYKTINICYTPTHKLTEKQYDRILNREFDRDTLFVDGMFAKNCKKVIATTDHDYQLNGILKIGRPFVKRFEDAENTEKPMTEVDVEYNFHITEQRLGHAEGEFFPNSDDRGFIIVTDEKVFSRKEMKRACSRAWLKGNPNVENCIEEFNNWFDNNY